jgi:hypothetical protein
MPATRDFAYGVVVAVFFQHLRERQFNQNYHRKTRPSQSHFDGIFVLLSEAGSTAAN